MYRATAGTTRADGPGLSSNFSSAGGQENHQHSNTSNAFNTATLQTDLLVETIIEKYLGDMSSPIIEELSDAQNDWLWNYTWSGRMQAIDWPLCATEFCKVFNYDIQVGDLQTAYDTLRRLKAHFPKVGTVLGEEVVELRSKAAWLPIEEFEGWGRLASNYDFSGPMPREKPVPLRHAGKRKRPAVVALSPEQSTEGVAAQTKKPPGRVRSIAKLPTRGRKRKPAARTCRAQPTTGKLVITPIPTDSDFDPTVATSSIRFAIGKPGNGVRLLEDSDSSLTTLSSAATTSRSSPALEETIDSTHPPLGLLLPLNETWPAVMSAVCEPFSPVMGSPIGDRHTLLEDVSEDSSGPPAIESLTQRAVVLAVPSPDDRDHAQLQKYAMMALAHRTDGNHDVSPQATVDITPQPKPVLFTQPVASTLRTANRPFPRTAYTKERTIDTEEMVRKAEEAIDRAPLAEMVQYGSDRIIFRLVEFLGALRSVPMDRDVWVHCNSVDALREVAVWVSEKQRYAALMPYENYVSPSTVVKAKFRKDDLVQEILRLIRRKELGGWNTWIVLDEDEDVEDSWKTADED